MENGPFEDVFPIKNCDIPACYVSLPEGNVLPSDGDSYAFGTIKNHPRGFVHPVAKKNFPRLTDSENPGDRHMGLVLKICKRSGRNYSTGFRCGYVREKLGVSVVWF